MGSENRAEFVLSFDGDDAPLAKVFDILKGKVRTQAQAIEKITSDVQLFKNARADLEKASTAVEATSAQLAKMRKHVEDVQSAGESVGKDLAKGLKDAERASASAERELAKQTRTVDALDQTLRTAGVDTSRLAQEQNRLTIATRQAAAAEDRTQAARTLGIKLTSETNAEYAKLKGAYDTIRQSGTATFADLSAASAAFRARTAELSGSTTSLFQAFQAVRAPVLGFVAGVAGMTAAAKQAISASVEFEQGLSRVGAVSNLSKEQVDALGSGVRELAQTAGVKVPEALEAMQRLLRAGIPAGNVLEQIATADDVAKASLTDLSTATELQITLFKAFGVSAKDVKPTLDGFFTSMKNGGPTFDVLATGLGRIGPLARTTGTSLAEISAVLETLTRSGLSGEEAIGALEQILLRFSDPQVRGRLRDLGIEGQNIVDVFAQLQSRGLGIQEVLGLEIASKKSAVAVAELASRADRLADSVARFGKSKGAIDGVAASVANIRAEALERLSISVSNLVTTTGDLISPTTATIDKVTALVQLLNNLGIAAERAGGSSATFGRLFNEIAQTMQLAISPFERYRVIFELVAAVAQKVNTEVAKAAEESRAAVLTVGESEQALAASVAAQGEVARAKLAELRSELAAFVPQLQKAAASLRALGDDALASIDAQAQVQIAALDKLANSEAEIVKRTIEIQSKAAADKLALLKKSSDEVLAAIKKESEIRLLAAGDNAKEIARIEADIAATKQATLTTIIAKYREYVATLTALETQHLNKVKELNDSRRDLQIALEDKLRNLRSAGLTEYDRYSQNLQEIDRSTSKARQALANGDFKAAEAYAKKAIELSDDIKGGVKSDGREIVSALQAQEIAAGKVKDGYNVLFEVNKKRVQAEKDGAAETKRNLEEAQTKARDLTTELNTLSSTLSKGLNAKVNIDTSSIEKAKTDIDALNNRNTSSTHTIHIVTVNDGGGGGGGGDFVGPPSPGFARGGAVPRFARGGRVAFRPPAWSKVPGTGSGDTVPAALQPGSFVVRKAASAYYGDRLMSRLAGGAQRFAKGGKVSEEDVKRWASMIDPKKGFQTGDSFQNNEPPLNFDSRPIPEAWITAMNVITYAREMLNSVGRNHPILGSLLPAIEDGIRAVERNPANESALKVLLRAAETIGANPYVFAMWGKTAGSKAQAIPIWFVDWMEKRGFNPAGAGRAIPLKNDEFAKKFFGLLMGGSKSPFLNIGRFFRGYAHGGSTDTVPALLTPGEYVVRRSAVRRYGEDFMHAINAMQIPRSMLAGMMAPPMPASVRRFADGGVVNSGIDSASIPSSEIAVAREGRPGVNVGVTVNANAGDILSARNINNLIIPAVFSALRKAGIVDDSNRPFGQP